MSGESEKHFVHRLEAFSDIVIGFSLAQLGVNLVIPANGAELFQNPSWLIAFAVAFAAVCSMWFFHHLLFVRCFVPKALPVIINFIWLGIVILLVFASELNVRMPTDIVVVRMYFFLYGLAYAILGLQYVISLRYLGSSIDAADRARAQRAMWFMFLWTVPFSICFVASAALPIGNAFGIITMLSFAVASIGSWLLASYYGRADVLEKRAG